MKAAATTVIAGILHLMLVPNIIGRNPSSPFSSSNIVFSSSSFYSSSSPSELVVSSLFSSAISVDCFGVLDPIVTV
jgi:hypothetical protein